MKFIWEEKDVIPGRKYSRAGIQETWMIGYRAECESDKQYVSISLSDGMVTLPSSKEDLSITLSQLDYVPIEYLYKKE